MLKTYLVSLTVFLWLISGCTSMHEASRRYFQRDPQMMSIESPDAVITRLNNDKAMRTVLYNAYKPGMLIQCTFLRNQLVVAAREGVSGEEGKAVKEAALLIERAFQEDDQAFLHACEAIRASKVGAVFLQTQEQFFDQQ